jgi:hypothetical protein
LTTLPFELYLHKHQVFLASSSSENQKAADFQKRRFLGKRMDYHPGKSLTFWMDINFLQTTPQILHEERRPLYLPDDTKNLAFCEDE